MGRERIRKILASPVMGFAPWIAFSVLEGPGRYEIATGTALAVALLELVLGMVVGARPKLLDVSASVFFVVMLVGGLLAGHEARQWLDKWSGELSNVMLVMIALASVAFRVPFTIQYAREATPRTDWDTPLFFHINYALTWVWTASFAVTAAVGWYGDGPLNQPDNVWTNWIIQIALLIFAIRFTEWYPEVAVARAQSNSMEDSGSPAGSIADLFLPLAGYLVPIGIVLLAIGGSPWWVGVALMGAGVLSARALQTMTAASTGGEPSAVRGPSSVHSDVAS